MHRRLEPKIVAVFREGYSLKAFYSDDIFCALARAKELIGGADSKQKSASEK
jgi:hypothetical protein